jgi:hypothetical protein
MKAKAKTQRKTKAKQNSQGKQMTSKVDRKWGW